MTRHSNAPFHCRTQRCRKRGAFTLFEAMLAVGLLATVVASLAQVVTAGQMETYDSLREVKAMSLAEAMMEEILSQPYDDPGGSVNANKRSTFDYIGNYAGYTEAAGALTDGQDVLYSSDYQVFSVAVSVTAGSLTLTGISGSTSGETVAVNVSDAHGHTWTVTQFVPGS